MECQEKEWSSKNIYWHWQRLILSAHHLSSSHCGRTGERIANNKWNETICIREGERNAHHPRQDAYKWEIKIILWTRLLIFAIRIVHDFVFAGAVSFSGSMRFAFILFGSVFRLPKSKEEIKKNPIKTHRHGHEKQYAKSGAYLVLAVTRWIVILRREPAMELCDRGTGFQQGNEDTNLYNRLHAEFTLNAERRREILFLATNWIREHDFRLFLTNSSTKLDARVQRSQNVCPSMPSASAS